MSVKIQKPKLLIVEGRDEQFCFEAALRDHLAELSQISREGNGGRTSVYLRLKPCL